MTQSCSGTPMILHPKSNSEWAFSRYMRIQQIFKANGDTFSASQPRLAIHSFRLLHRDTMSNGVSLTTLFELASKGEVFEETLTVLIFGNDDGKNGRTFYHDEEENIWVGIGCHITRRSLASIYEEDRSLTLHNVAVMRKGGRNSRCVCKHFKNGKSKGIRLHVRFRAGKFMGFQSLGNEKIKNIEIVFGRLKRHENECKTRA